MIYRFLSPRASFFPRRFDRTTDRARHEVIFFQLLTGAEDDWLGV